MTVSRRTIAGDPEIGVGRVIIEYDKVARWLRGLGFDPGTTRFGTYRRALAGAQGQALATLPREVRESAVEGLLPCLELVDVYRDLAPFVDARILKQRLRRLLRGPAMEADESTTTNTTDARNVGFELVMGASLRRSGLVVCLPEVGDVDAAKESASAAVECKRVQSANGLQEALASARSQLEGRVDPTMSTLRVAALDVSLLVRSPSHLVAAESNEELIDYIARESSRALAPITKSILAGCARTVDAVILVIAAPAHARRLNFWTRAEHRLVIRVDENLDDGRKRAFESLRPGLLGPASIRRS